MEHLGAAAIATTSAGFAWANGYPDGDRVPIEVLVAGVRAMTRVVRVPVSVDIEDGYADDPQAVAETVRALVDEGAVGINLEDGAGPPERLAAKIERIRAVAGEVFVNARTDVILRGLPAADPVAEVIRRGRLYAEAGASGLFAPKVVEVDAITA